jgi:hypothetical protein
MAFVTLGAAIVETWTLYPRRANSYTAIVASAPPRECPVKKSRVDALDTAGMRLSTAVRIPLATDEYAELKPGCT